MNFPPTYPPGPVLPVIHNYGGTNSKYMYYKLPFSSVVTVKLTFIVELFNIVVLCSIKPHIDLVQVQ